MRNLTAIILLFISTSVSAQNVILYEDMNFQGYGKSISANWNSTYDWTLNDKISSIVVPQGIKIIVFADADFRGDFMELTANWSVASSQETWNNRISSIIFLDYNKGNSQYNPNPSYGLSCINLDNHRCAETAICPEQNITPGNGYFMSMEAAIKNPSQVRVLDLRNQNLSSWPNYFYEMKNLEELYISGNQFNAWPNYFYELKKLRILVADHNNISSWPNYFYELKSLEVLNISYNPLISWPAYFYEMKNLKELDVSHTQLNSLPPYFYQLPNLTHLNISNTSINSLGSYLYELKLLHFIDIRNTGISIIPNEIKEKNIVILK